MTTTPHGQQKLNYHTMRINFDLYVGLFALGLCIALFLGSPAHAQSAQESAQASPLAGLYACQKLEPLADRYACYDRATTALKDAETQGEFITLSANEYKEIQEGVFGYKHAPLAQQGTNLDLENAGQDNTLQTMTMPVKKVERYLSGFVITLDNNQVWEQFAGSISRVPKGNLVAEIKTTPTGTYKMVLFNTKYRITNIKVRRIQ